MAALTEFDICYQVIHEVHEWTRIYEKAFRVVKQGLLRMYCLSHLQQHLQHTLLPGFSHSLQAIVQTVAGIDQRLDVNQVGLQ